MSDKETPWVVKGVPELTRQTVKVYAAANSMTMAEAVQLLISRGVAAGITTTNESALGVLRDMPDKVLAELARRVAEETKRRSLLPPEEHLAEEDLRLRSPDTARAESGAQDTDVKRLFAEFVRGTAEETTDES